MISNDCRFIGRLTKDPQLSHVDVGGQPVEVCNMTLAVDKLGKDRGANFIPISAWRQDAINCVNHLMKGSLVAIEGTLEVRPSDKGDDGKWRAPIFSIAVKEIRFLDRYNKAGPGQGAVDAEEDMDPTAGMMVDSEPDMFPGRKA